MIRDDVLRKAVEGIVQVTNLATGSASLNNGDATTFSITIQNGAGALINSIPDLTLYHTQKDNAHRFTEGTSVNMPDWVVIGPWSDLFDNDNVNQVWKIYVRNVSAGSSQTVLLSVVGRLIVNSLTTGGSA